jgi:DNA-binding XRE family transcriptional regulator
MKESRQNRLGHVELIPGRQPATTEMRDSWRRARARTRLSAVRLREKVRQEDLANAIGVSTATLRRIESGEMGAGTPIGYLIACACALEVPLTSLIEDEWIAIGERVEKPRRGVAPFTRLPIPAPPP